MCVCVLALNESFLCDLYLFYVILSCNLFKFEKEYKNIVLVLGIIGYGSKAICINFLL